jgi:subtilisin family serine protease
VRRGADCLGGTCTRGPAHRDRCGHGTHVAGTVASKTFGVAPRATILPVRVLHWDRDRKECTGTTVDVAHGIRWATHHGAQVINLSLAPKSGGITITQRVDAAAQDAIDAGIVVVFAAGNQGKAVADNYGGRALIVAATGPRGGLAPYSQHGKGVTIAAPGGYPGSGSDAKCTRAKCIASTWVELKNGNIHREYALLAGTSMAAPHVSGIAALLIAEHPKRSMRSVTHAIYSTARPLIGAGHGKISAAAALGVRPPEPTATRTSRTTHAHEKTRVSAADATRPTASRPAHVPDARAPRQGVALVPHRHRTRIELPRRAALPHTGSALPTGPVGAATAALLAYAVTFVALRRRRPGVRTAT